MQFASLISSLINIISLLVTSFNSAVTLKLKCGKVACVEFFIFGGSLLGRIQGDREPVSLSIQGMYGYICYFHNEININIPVYLITPALLPHLCAIDIELKV